MKIRSSGSARQFPSVRVFCPDCGGSASITAMFPVMFPPAVEEITYRCNTCGGETKVQIPASPAAAAT